MISHLLLIAGLMAPTLTDGGPAEDDPRNTLTVVSFNVLVEHARFRGFSRWEVRRDLCVAALEALDADLIGLQEPTPPQLDYLVDKLRDFDSFAVGKYTDSAILYRRDRFEKLDEGHWWLSPTPERMSTGFGNFAPRLVVWLKLRHRPSGRDLYFFNTHFDNSKNSQAKMAEVCEQQMKPFLEQGLPLIFAGDFNTDQRKGDYARLTSHGWRDSYRASPEASPDGRDDNVPTMVNGDGRIDHIFYHGPLEATTWRRFESPEPETPFSDHYGVMTKLRFTK